MALRTEGPPRAVSGPRKWGLRRRLSRLFLRSKVSMEELKSGQDDADGSRLAAPKEPLARCDMAKKTKRRNREQNTFGRVNEEENGSICLSHASESPSPSTSQKSAPKILPCTVPPETFCRHDLSVISQYLGQSQAKDSLPQIHVLSYSEPNLWRNGFMHRFGSLAWRKRRGSQLELSEGFPASDPWFGGRFQRPAVGSNLDMKRSFDLCLAVSHLGEQEGNLESFSHPYETDSAEASLTTSTSFNSLLCWGEESGAESFSLSMSSVHCPTSPEPIDETARCPSVQEGPSRTPESLLEWAERVFEEYLSSGIFCPITEGGSEGLNSGSSLRESASEQISGAKGPITTAASPHAEQAPQTAALAVPVGPPKVASKVCYAVVVTMTKAEKEDGQGEPAGNVLGRGLLCHMPGEAALSLGVAELEKATEQRHQKPARPAPQLPAHKECQNCRGLQRVGTSQVCRLIPTPAAGSLVAGLKESEPRLSESEDQSGCEPLQSRNGVLTEAPSAVRPGSLASSSPESYLASSSKDIPSKKLFDTERAPFPVPSSMEKGTGSSRSRHQSKAGVSVVSNLFGRKKIATEPPKDEVKPPSGKGSAASRMKDRSRTSSPSKVSMLLEAWEKGLVGTESAGSLSSADARRSRSPVSTRRLLSSKNASHSLSPTSTKSSLSPIDARRSIFSADTSQSPSPSGSRRSHSPADTTPSFSRLGTRRSHSPVETRRPLSPTDSKHFFSSPDTRRSQSPAETKRSLSPSGTRQSSSPASTRRSHSPADIKRSHSPVDSLQSSFLEDLKYTPSKAGARRLSSPVRTQYSSLAADNHGSSSPVDKRYSSFLPDINSSYSVADIRRLYCPEDSRPASSPTNARRRSSSPASTRSPLSSPADSRSPFSRADARPLSSLSDVKSSSSPRDSRSFSPTSDERRSRSLSPRREFATHGPVFAQVYTPVSKPKSHTGKEVQDVNGTTEENHSWGASPSSLATGIQKESYMASTDGSQKGGLLPSTISTRMLESEKEPQVLGGTSSGASPGSLRTSHPPSATVLRFQTESYMSRAANHFTSFSDSMGENESVSTVCSPSSVNTKPSVLNPLPHMVSTESQAQWYSSKGSGTVVFRSEQQVVLPQAGRATVYTTGREIIMSSAGVGNISQQDKPPFPSSSSNALSKDNLLQLQDGDAKSPKGSLTTIPDTSSSSPVESWLESCMTQPSSATPSDTHRQRCVLLPNPAFTSKEDVNTFREEVGCLSTLREDCRMQGKAASQRLSSSYTESRSERAKSMPEPSSPERSASELESIQARIEKICSSGSSQIWSGSEVGGKSAEIRRLETSTGSQESAPGDPKTTTWTAPKEEQSDPPKDSQVSTWEPTSSFTESNSSPDLLTQKKGRNSSKTTEEEPEEAVDMELFVDTLRNMEPPELRKPLKLPTRPPRPSKLAKNAPLPPIHEHHATPKSKVALPAALGELFALEEERNLEEEKGGKEEDGGLMEEVEVIVNPYPSKDEMQQYDHKVRKPYPWENQLYKTEEEIGSFLGKLQQGSVHHRTSTATGTKVVVGPNNFIRANVLKGLSLVSDFPDKKVVEEKPYSRLDNSLLYSRFICPEKSQFRPVENGNEGKFSPSPPMPAVIKVNRECQTSPNGLQVNPSEELNSKFLPSEPREEHSSRVPSANGGSSQMSPLSSEVLPQHVEKKVPKINLRPGKIILYSESGFGGQKREIWGDITDATSWELSPTISIRVVRGGWVMYEKPRFHGRKCVLAEGDVEITNPWKMYRKKGLAPNTPFRIGSLKRVVRDYKIPEIALFSEENGEGAKWSFADSAEDTRICNCPLRAASIIVHSGLWLVYSKPFFDDDPYVLEPGGYPSLQAWGAKDPSVCSLHPIKLGRPVVEKPGEPKALIYEEPHFQGHSWEVCRDIYDVKKPENSQESKMPTVGSLKILGGCWVGYEKEGFRGHQYLLEEGEYRSWTQWGGFNEQLVSLRLIRTDFLDPALVLFEAMDFEDGPSVELCEALPDVELASYGNTTQSIHVLSGVWVAYEDKNFTGEQYILEKGVYRNCEDWGASNCQISSVQPILQVGEDSLHFISKLQLFSDPNFLGKHISFTEDQASLPENFIPHSCRVHGGSWILYDNPQFDGEQHVLSEGDYPSLTSMGCLLTTSIRSLKKVPIFFSEPSIFLHGLECFEGKEIELNGEVRSLQAEGFNNHVLSVRVKGGIWVLCEHSDFRGRQWLLNCTEITNWLTYSGLQHIGSLYPIRQKRIYFRIKNEELKSYLSVPDDVEDMKAGRVLVSELSDKISSIWYYEEGLLKNQVAPGMSLQVIGPAGKGAKVVLWSENRVPRQAWQVDSFGRICSQMFEDKVLDVKGGRTYDRDHAILWELSEKRPTQIWDVQVL